VNATWDKPVRNFALSDIVVMGGTATNFVALAGGVVYTFDIVPSATVIDITVNIAAGVCTDLAYNPNLPATPLLRHHSARDPGYCFAHSTLRDLNGQTAFGRL